MIRHIFRTFSDFFLPARAAYKNAERAPERQKAPEQKAESPQRANSWMRAEFRIHWEKLRNKLDMQKKSRNPKLKQVAEKFRRRMESEVVSPAKLGVLDEATIDKNLQKMKDILKEFETGTKYYWDVQRGNAPQWMRKTMEEQRSAEIYEEESLDDALYNYVWRTMDNLYGKAYSWDARGKVTGRYKPLGDDPVKLLSKMTKYLNRLPDNKSYKVKSGKRWTFERDGLTFEIRTTGGPGEKPEFKVSLTDISDSAADRFPKIADYVDSGGKPQRRMAKRPRAKREKGS